MRLTNLLVLLPIMLSPTLQAGLSVTQIKATAETNGYAPLDGSQYFDEHIVENVSPAIASASGDWIGTNVGSSTPTWHWIGAANVNVTTSSAMDSLAINGSGTFSYDVTTTSDFINPNTVELMYGPGSASDYFCAFTVDQPSTFTMTAELSRYSLVRFYSFTANTAIFSKINNSATPFNVNVSGIIPPGSYSVGANTNRGAGLPPGAIHEIASGSFTNFNFTVAVPEPSVLGVLGFFGLFLRRRR